MHEAIEEIRNWEMILFYYSYIHYNSCFVWLSIQEPGLRRRHSDWSRAARPRSQSSCSGKVQNFHFSIPPRPDLGSAYPLIQCVPGGKTDGV
jgi:hypothetical protein